MTHPPPADPDRPSLRYWIKAGFGIGIGLCLCWLVLSLLAMVVVAVLSGVWQQQFIGALGPFNSGPLMPFNVGAVQVVLWVTVAAFAAWLFVRWIVRKQ